MILSLPEGPLFDRDADAIRVHGWVLGSVLTLPYGRSNLNVFRGSEGLEITLSQRDTSQPKRVLPICLVPDEDLMKAAMTLDEAADRIGPVTLRQWEMQDRARRWLRHLAGVLGLARER